MLRRCRHKVKRWQRNTQLFQGEAERLPFRDVDDLSYDPDLGKVLVSSRSSDQIYAIDPKTSSWEWWQTGYRIGLVRFAGKRLVAASLYDGVLLEPVAGSVETAQK